MSHALTALIILATSLLAPPAPQGLLLRYRPEVGQTAVYRVSMDMSGAQTLQDEPRTVNVRAEMEVTEKVMSLEPDGSFWLRVTGRAVRIHDPTGTFGAGQYGEWPAVEVRLSPLGVVMETRPDPEAGHLGPLQRAFAAAMSHPAPVVLPTQAVKVGDRWQWEQDRAHQSNRLVSVTQAGGPIAHICGGAQLRCLLASSGREPVRLDEASPALGLTTSVSGEVTQTCEVELLLPSGLAVAHTGEMRLKTEGESVLELPQEPTETGSAVNGAKGASPRTISLKSDLRVRLHLRLVALNGSAVPGG